MPNRVSILGPGRNCWRSARANRFAVIVDAQDYFRALRAAMLEARHSIFLIGWDFDTRIDLVPEEPEDDVPHALGDFLNWIAERRPELEIRILKWDLGMVKTVTRGSTPLVILDWVTRDRIHFRLDGAHPPLGAHHQKIAVIDDALAFCGGIDMTIGRWDRRQHLDDDPLRTHPGGGSSYEPWHDVSTAVSGPAAALLGELARDRWRRATEETVEPPPRCAALWPACIEPLLEGVEVAVSRTMPTHNGSEDIREIEHLYLDAIACARRTLYIESQYFAARRIAEAIIARLLAPEGPEIVVVNPETAHGWLEEEVMGASRAVLLDMVRKADVHGRFRIYHPVTEGGRPIYVHAKVMVVDDRLLRVGSSNLNNRSMGFDSECDLSIEAPPGPEGDAIRERIIGLRDDLIAEHLGTDPETVARAVAAQGSLIAAIEALRGEGRSLVPFEPPELGTFRESVLAENSLLDPERADAGDEQKGLAGLLPWRRG